LTATSEVHSLPTHFLEDHLYMRRDGLTKVVTLNLDPRSYAIFSTRPKDRARHGRLIAKWGLQDGISRFVSGEDA
jgi:type IV secretion system protein VirB4